MPGAGTLPRANTSPMSAPKNGTALGIVSETLAVEQALKNAAVQDDAANLTWIGRVAASNAVHIQWHTSEGASIEERQKVRGNSCGNRRANVGRDRAEPAQRGDPARNQDRRAAIRRRTSRCSPWSAAKSRAPPSTGDGEDREGDWLREKKVKSSCRIADARTRVARCSGARRAR